MRILNLKFLTIIILAAFIAGCSTNKKPESEYLDAAKAKLDEKKYEESITLYREFIKEYPKSDKTIFAYNQIAGIQIDGLKDQPGGIITYKELSEKFPGTKEAKQSMFMVAFIYDETLKDKDNAIKAYKDFLAKYPTDTDPNDKMSESAKTMLEVLQSGRSIEEIIQMNIDKMGNQSAGDSVKKNLKDVQKQPDPSDDKGTDKKQVDKDNESPKMPALKKEADKK
ncbi:MAG: tetratricopeptide repeat protein [Ignavibacteria bacterium]